MDTIHIHKPTDDGSVYGDVTLIRDLTNRHASVSISRKELPEVIRQLQIINAGQQDGSTVIIPRNGDRAK